jgi:hypothetical protein
MLSVIGYEKLSTVFFTMAFLDIVVEALRRIT